MSEIQRIQNDLARAKQRAAEIESGQRGVRSGQWLDTDGSNPGAGLAHSAQLRGQRDAIARLEGELVMAMLPKWGAAAVLERMTAAPAPTPEPVIQIKTVTVDETRRALEALLTGPDKFFSRTCIKELLE